MPAPHAAHSGSPVTSTFCNIPPSMKLQLSPEFIRGILVSFVVFQGADLIVKFLSTPSSYGFVICIFPTLIVAVHFWLITLLLLFPTTCARIAFKILLGLSLLFTALIALAGFAIQHFLPIEFSGLKHGFISAGAIYTSEYIGATIAAYYYCKMQNKTVHRTIHSSALSGESKLD